MSNSILQRVLTSAAIALGVGVAAGSLWGVPVAAGILVGGVWNLLSLWCLARLLGAWMGPTRSTRHVLGWLLLKVPCLYAAAIWLFLSRPVSILPFGVGFTIVLLSAAAHMAIRPLSFSTSQPHGG